MCSRRASDRAWRQGAVVAVCCVPRLEGGGNVGNTAPEIRLKVRACLLPAFWKLFAD